MTDKQYFYSHVRIFGAATFILLSLVTGPLVGYFAGDYIVKNFSLPAYVMFICIGLGFLSSLFEIIRITKFLLKHEAH